MAKCFCSTAGMLRSKAMESSAEISSPDRLSAAIPPDHLAFYQALVNWYVTEPYFCVHAGVNPLKTLPEQTDEELLWIRHPFLYSSHVLPYTILFGHTPQHSVLYDLPYKIGLDTGLVYGNMLTCFDTDEKDSLSNRSGQKAREQSFHSAKMVIISSAFQMA